MSESYDYADQSDDEYEAEPEPESSGIKALRKKASRADAAEAKYKELEAQMAQSRKDQQELAMRRAQIDPGTPLAQMFAKANPDLVDVDTIASEWAKVAAAAGPSPDQDAAAYGRINAAQAGGSPGGGAVPDFEGELDSIPMLVDGNWNPDFVTDVMKATQVQAARENRQFVVDGGRVQTTRTKSASQPAVTPLS